MSKGLWFILMQVGGLLLILGGTFLYAFPVFAGEGSDARSLRLEILDCGLYEAETNGVKPARDKVNEAEEAEGLPLKSNMKLVEETDRVPGRIGMIFGCRFKLVGAEEEHELSYSIDYERPVHNPENGKVYKSSEWSEVIPQGQGRWSVGWEFEEKWEIVSGRWSFKVMSGRRLLLEKTFQVYPEE